MRHANTRCHSQHNHRHCKHTRGPSSFWMHDPVQVFREIQLKEGDCFLDLGCGPGDYAIHASKIVGATGIVYALDRWEQMIGGLINEVDTQGLHNIKAIVTDITAALPLGDNSVNVGLMATVLHTLHLKEDGKTLFDEIYRVLNPDGQVAIIECKKERQGFGPPEYMRLSPEEIEEAITPHGFETLNVVDLGNNYLIRFGVKKKTAARV